MSSIDFSVARKHLEANACAFYKTDLITRSTTRVISVEI